MQWEIYFTKDQMKARDNRIFFNFTQDSLNDLRAEPALSNFGGEQVHMPIQSFRCIGDKLKKMGRPLIIKCKLNPKVINTFIENPWGQIAVSSYHRLQNPNAATIDQDGYQTVNVPPENIEIIECKNI